MTAFDLIALGTIGILMLISMMRGLVSEIVSLSRWLLGLLAAWLFAGTLADFALSKMGSRVLAHTIAFVIVFVLIFVLMYMLRELLNSIVSRIGLGSINRLLGAIFGCAKGIILVTLVVMLCALTDLPSKPVWKMSLTAPFFQDLGQMALPYVQTVREDMDAYH